MKASIVPFDAASKQSNGGMIWPPGKTSIRSRPPLISSTAFASPSAAPVFTSSVGFHAVDIRHWTLGWAMTEGASAIAVAAAIAAPPAVARKLRRSVVTLLSSPRHELMIGALGDVIPGAHQRLELREGCVHL